MPAAAYVLLFIFYLAYVLFIFGQRAEFRRRARIWRKRNVDASDYSIEVDAGTQGVSTLNRKDVAQTFADQVGGAVANVAMLIRQGKHRALEEKIEHLRMMKQEIEIRNTLTRVQDRMARTLFHLFFWPRSLRSLKTRLGAIESKMGEMEARSPAQPTGKVYVTFEQDESKFKAVHRFQQQQQTWANRFKRLVGTAYHVREAPAPYDIIYDNLECPVWRRRLRRLFTTLLLMVTLAVSIGVQLVLQILRAKSRRSEFEEKAESLAKGKHQESGGVNELISSAFSGAVLLVANELLKYVIRFSVYFEKPERFSKLEAALVFRMGITQVRKANRVVPVHSCCQ